MFLLIDTTRLSNQYLVVPRGQESELLDFVSWNNHQRNEGCIVRTGHVWACVKDCIYLALCRTFGPPCEAP